MSAQSHIYNIGLRSRELFDRVWWFINMRWFAVALCLLGTISATIKIVPATLNPVYFLSSMIFLIITNLIYTFLTRRITKNVTSDIKKIERLDIRTLLIVQVITDYIALSLIVYACGTIETPILILFIAHIILITLFFSRTLSLLITFLGLLFSSLPMILELNGAIPVITIFHTSFKQIVSTSLPITSYIILGLAGCYLVCWYLVSEISTSLKIKERKLEEAYEMLIMLDKEKTQSVLRATHELKAPLAAIKSYVYILRDGYCGQLTQKAQQIVAKIGERCDRLTVNIIDIIRLSNIKTLILTEKNFTNVDLKDFIKNEVRDADIIGKSRGITIHITKKNQGKSPIFIRASKEHLHIMLSNILQNAITYSYDQGIVEVDMDKKDGKVLRHIVDHGIGIPNKNINNIFDEHFRCNNAVQHNPNGNGLGLAIVKEIANLHNASIDIYSEPGKETHFTITFDIIE